MSSWQPCCNDDGPEADDTDGTDCSQSDVSSTNSWLLIDDHRAGSTHSCLLSFLITQQHTQGLVYAFETVSMYQVITRLVVSAIIMLYSFTISFEIVLVHPGYSAEECFRRIHHNLKTVLRNRHLPLVS